MATVTPVIMCGGTGTRLWPLSRIESPKQFQRIDSQVETTFFQATIQRHRTALFDNPMVLINRTHVGIVKRQLNSVQQTADIVVEPCGRNTAPAMAVAALRAAAINPEKILLTLPSDHLLSTKFNNVVENAVDAAVEGYIVTFGIRPTHPETGYGYILDGGQLNGFDTINKVERFVEKPSFEVAKALFAGASSYWASGIAMFQAQTLIDEFSKYAPDILEAAQHAIDEGSQEKNCFYLNLPAYAKARNTSCEYAVIEQSSRIVLAPAAVEWDDVGAWSAFHRIGEKNTDGNVTSGDVLLVDTKNSYVRSQEKLVTVIGLSNIVVVDTADALLIADMSKTQAVKTAVELLQKARRNEVVKHHMVVEDWGISNVLATGNHFSLRHVQVVPDNTATLGGIKTHVCILSVIQGEGEAITIEGNHTLSPGNTLEFGPDTIITIRNTSNIELHVIEMLIDRERATDGIASPISREDLAPVAIAQHA